MGAGMRAARKACSAIINTWSWLLVVGVASLWGYSRVSGGFGLGLRAGESLLTFLIEMALVLPPMFLLVGLFEVWVPRELVERYVGRRAGIAAILWMVLLATMQAGPLYTAFPVAMSLWRKGCSPRNVFIYLGAFSTLKIPMVTFEVAFLGWQFSVARSAITIPVFILLAIIMERMLPSNYMPPGLDDLSPGV